MNSKGIMRRARRQILVFVSTMLVVTVGFAQTPPERSDEDLDVTMRIIVDPDAKVPDEIVRRIPLPKPQQSAATATEKSNKQNEPDKPAEKGKERLRRLTAQGREFGQQTAEQAKQRADEARRNNDKPPKPPKPPNPQDPPDNNRRADRAKSPRRAAFALFVGIALLSGARTHAATVEAQARFTEARAAFDSQDFPQALALFEQALALGMDGPAVHYNIGVAAYRSGDLARAERAFQEVARTPAMAALAHYNLGLVALQRGDSRTARDEFQRAARDAGDERLAALATRRLEEFPPAPPPADWSLYARGGAGYDDNVALRSESIDGSASGEDDAFAELLGSASVAFGQHWHVDAAAALLDYIDLDEFDQGVISLGARRGFALDAWYLEARRLRHAIDARPRRVRTIRGRGPARHAQLHWRWPATGALPRHCRRWRR